MTTWTLLRLSLELSLLIGLVALLIGLTALHRHYEAKLAAQRKLLEALRHAAVEAAARVPSDPPDAA